MLQRGKGGLRSQMYYPYNRKLYQGLKNEQWAIMVFIITAKQYNFTDIEIIKELHIKENLYAVLVEELPNILSKSFEDQTLTLVIKKKCNLVRNSIQFTFSITPLPSFL